MICTTQKIIGAFLKMLRAICRSYFAQIICKPTRQFADKPTIVSQVADWSASKLADSKFWQIAFRVTIFLKKLRSI